MNTLWTSADVEEATGGTSSSAWNATGVSIDSRKINKGDLFIAIIGDNQDGHEYVASALENGAAAAVVNYVPEGVDVSAPLLIVEDSTEALWDLARFSRGRIAGKIALVTGSVGKTSTKEMLAHVLERQGKTYATEGNLNNHYGLPLTLARMPANVDYGILEVGMNHAGEISPLSVLADPDVAVITNIEPVHLEFFDSVENIADAKAEIFDGLGQGGVAILNRDNKYFLHLKGVASGKNVEKIVGFGKGEGADFRLVEYKDKEDGSEVVTICEGSELMYKLGISGIHQALNSLAVLAVVNALGGDMQKAAGSLSSFEAKEGRGKLHKVRGDFGEAIIIDDSYNASPASVAAALKVLGNIKANSGKRVIAVLGDMFELGDASEKMHMDVLKKLVENNIDLVFTAGSMMKKLYAKLPDGLKGASADDSDGLAPIIANTLQDGDVVLVKGSRGMRMEKVVENFVNGA